MSGYQSITFEEYGDPFSSSSQPVQQYQSPASAIHDTAHSTGGGILSQPGPSSNKHKASFPPDSEQPPKKRQRKCQKCGIPTCGGRATRMYCKNPCQDCGKMECHGRNSQHPKKTCLVGWGFHHKNLK